ncbi:MAG: hypothetical protein HY267_00770 [Deltaproteobacteria bacterium]|nr:hypothetical protein [Deltaproteobacteria bacterium]
MSEISDAPTLRDRFEALNAATSQEASTLAAQRKRATLWGLVMTPFLTFLGTYFKRGAWRKGVAGLVEAVFASYAAFVRQVKLWELQHIIDNSPSPPRA